MRLIAKSLLVLLVMAGLALPKSFARTHEVTCESTHEHGDAEPFDLADLLPADDTPLDEWATDCGGCGGHEHDEGDHDHHDPLHSHSHSHSHSHQHQHDDGDDCPDHHHHHHHHHQCVCTAATAWLISDTNSFSLHPPLQGHALAPAQFQFVPESPVFLLDRPPAS